MLPVPPLMPSLYAAAADTCAPALMLTCLCFSATLMADFRHAAMMLMSPLRHVLIRLFSMPLPFALAAAMPLRFDAAFAACRYGYAAM